MVIRIGKGHKVWALKCVCCVRVDSASGQRGICTKEYLCQQCYVEQR